MNKKDKYNLLLIDDRVENLIALESILDDPKFNLIKTTSGQEALAKVLEYEFALILADVYMPVMNGFEIAELLRGKNESKHIPIIFITAIKKEEKYIFKGYESGAVDYLLKPLDPEILKSKVNVFIDLFKQKKLIQLQADKLKQQMIKLNEAYSKLEKKEKAQKKLIAKLKAASDEVKKLSGMLPICSECKKIRDDKGYWNQIETYIESHTDVLFTHGLCSMCSDKLYGSEQWYKKMKKK